MPLHMLKQVAVATVVMVLSGSAGNAEPSHAFAMHGKPLMPADYTAFNYANPDAPKGGRVTYGVLGSFDSLNPFIVKGDPARGIRDGGQENYVIESMGLRGYDEAFTIYCLICRTIDVADDRSWVEFKIRPEAKFSDGHAITADDVLFSLDLLRRKGRPNLQNTYKKVVKTESPDPLTVRFIFADGADREIALIMALMPILPKHALTEEEFEKTSLTPPVGSGPYVIADVKPGQQLVLKRNPNYWAKDLPVKRGFDNYEEIRFDFYRSETALFEAFKAGQIDMIPDGEGDPNRWMTGYNFPAVTDGRIVRDTFKTGLPKPMYGFVFNTRKPLFADVRVREALSKLYDFEWVNKNLYFDLFKRTGSYFEGSELASLGRPADATERKLLAPYMDQVRPDVLEGKWAPSMSDGSGRDRALLKGVVDQLAAAGWKNDGGVMKNAAGEALKFELLLQTPEQEKLALAWQRNLKALGIDMSIRTLDSAQYTQRRNTFDFDSMVWTWAGSLSPGNEQNFRWSTQAATAEGSFNLAGVQSPAVDAMIKALLAARDRTEFVSAVRALDRLLISGMYVVPLQHQPELFMPHWARLQRPETSALWGAVRAAWWIKPGT